MPTLTLPLTKAYSTSKAMKRCLYCGRKAEDQAVQCTGCGTNEFTSLSWYYAVDNEQKGPVEFSEIEQAVKAGTLTASALVWNPGMPDWKAFREVVGMSAAAPSAPLPDGKVLCAECGRAFALEEVIRLDNRNICAACKPIAIQKLREGLVIESDSERVRKEHIKHEASIKSVGLLYFLGAGFLLLAGLGGLWGASVERIPPPELIFMSIVLLGLAGLQTWAGIGLRRLRSWARIPSGILSGIGLLAFPLGTVINAYILYLLFSKKGTTVFSENYQRIIAETPHIKYRTSILVWVLLGLLFLLIGIAFTVVLFSPRR